MKKIILTVTIVFCLAGLLLGGCNKSISANDAFNIVVEHLDVPVSEVQSPHIHEGTYNGAPCYDIYVTVGGYSHSYSISLTGEILSIGDKSHSH